MIHYLRILELYLDDLIQLFVNFSLCGNKTSNSFPTTGENKKL